MGLTDTIEKAIKDFEKRKDKSEVWEKLRKKLKKKGFKDCCEGIIADLGNDGAYEFLEVWDTLDEHLNKNGYDWDGNCKNDNIKHIKILSEIEGVKEIIKVLSEIGYELPTCKEEYKTCIHIGGSIQFFKTLEKEGLYKKCASVFKAFKNLGYQKMNSYVTLPSTQLDHLIRIAYLKEDAAGAIYILANKGYKIDGAIGINKVDFKNIEKITEEGKERIPIYLYNEGDAKIFQDYFNCLETKKKKSVLKSILDYETKTESEGSNNRKLNREWLEKDYKDLLREVGFED